MKNPMHFESPACAGINTEMFYPELHSIEYEPILKEICLSCPVYDDCLEWAIRKEAYGYWAGTNAKDRKRIRKSMGILEPLYHSEDYTNLRAG